MPPESESISEPEQILRSLLIPDNTRIEENRIVVDGDVIVGNHSSIEYGILGNTVIIGEGVNVSGEVVAKSDARIDMWSKLGSSVEVGKNAYLGEFVAIDGKLTVNGDLDVGKEVKVKAGFETKGWIVVRNPVPVIMFLFLYIREMMRLGKGEEVEKAIEDLFEDCEDDEESPRLGEKLLVVPAGTKVSPEAIEVSGEAKIGNSCILIGNIKAQSLEGGKGLTLQGSIHSEGKITLGDNSTVHGSLVSKGQVRIGRNSRIYGGIKADSVFLHEKARVDGTIRAPSGVSFIREPAEKTAFRKVQNSESQAAEKAATGFKENSPEEGLVKALEVVEIETLLKTKTKTKTKTKAKNGFVPGRERRSARTRALGRSRRFTGSRMSGRNSGTGEHHI
ncbi:hypothetical protein FTO70_15735 [Methanosarcina sp. KYL-1]|uniref:hypothetical protein n=1 Tax=Methanosarcina sp. KYL-1 TaxID=2602068 RepID=UPI002100B024|nr:hypothetical protein [Methanosarcina sp. KYL-1]MCQ1537097.1 hypothetical protein [Methanosarcina sp. KYL-1]